MARYKVILAYDGAQFHGSQRQQKEIRTVQGVLEQALGEIGWEGKTCLFAGRTDAGVHALGQVAVFNLDWSHSRADLQNALNALLPDDVAVRHVSQTSAEFHPRYDALSRTYRYRVFVDPVRQPLKERYAWRLRQPVALNRLRAAADLFVGIHDFDAFGRAMKPGGVTLREVYTADWFADGDELIFEIVANAFLYHMVRRLVYAQVAAGQEKLAINAIKKRLQAPETPPIQGLAPPQALTLLKVSYPSQKNSENDGFNSINK